MKQIRIVGIVILFILLSQTVLADTFNLSREFGDIISDGWIQSPTGGNSNDANLLTNDCSAAPTRGLHMYDLTRFTDAGLTADDVDEAYLNQYLLIDEGTFDVGVHDYTSTWVINSSASPKWNTHNSQFNATAEDTIGSEDGASAWTDTMNITNILKRHLRDGDKNMTLMIKGTTEAGGSCLNFGTAGVNAPGADNLINFVNITYTQAVATSIITIDYPSADDILDNGTWVIKVNGTVTDGATPVNYTWTNSTLFFNTTNMTTFEFWPIGTLPEGDYYFTVFSNDSTGITVNTSINFVVDTTDPNVEGATISSNNTLHYIGNNITFQVNITDNNQIFSFNITTPEGYKDSYTGLDTLKFIYNASFNASTYDVGQHNLTLNFCDAHTANEIEEFEHEKDEVKKELRYNFGADYVLVRPDNPNKIDSFFTNKHRDRYDFIYNRNPNARSSVQVFIVESSQKIEILGNKNGYYGHLVVPTLNKWIDFNLPNSAELVYSTRHITDYKVEVTISGISEDRMEFKSIGELNCGSQQYFYYIYNYSVAYNPIVTETSTENYVLTVDLDDIFLTTNQSAFHYLNTIGTTDNGTNGLKILYGINTTVPSVVANSSTKGFFFKFYLNGTQYQTINFTQIINRLQLVSCGALSQVRSLNFTFYDEQSPNTLLMADMEATLSAWTNDSTSKVNFTFDLNGSSYYEVCIFPNATINVDADVVYNTTGFTQRWFLRNAKVKNATSTITMFNFASSTGISDLRGTLRDTAYKVLPNTFAKLMRKYPSENLYRTVQMDKSDEFGQIIFHVLEETTDYIVVFDNGLAEVDRTNELKFICDSAICSLTFIVEDTTSVGAAAPLFTYGYNNATQIFQLNWSDSTGLTSKVRLQVERFKGDQSIPVCNQEVSSSSGTMNCNTSGHHGTLQVQVFTSASPEEYAVIFTIHKAVAKLFQQGVLNMNETALWAYGLSTLFVTMGAAISIPALIIFSIFSVVMISFLGLLSFYTWAYVGFLIVMGGTVAYLIRK